jgi:hypothetical protein
MMFVLAGVLALVGCGKPAPPATAQEGVTANLQKLREAFANASPELQSAVSEVAQGFRYGDYPTSMKALAKLDSAPGLTDAQKKAVAGVAEQIKQLVNKSPAPPP